MNPSRTRTELLENSKLFENAVDTITHPRHRIPSPSRPEAPTPRRYERTHAEALRLTQQLHEKQRKEVDLQRANHEVRRPLQQKVG